MHWFFSKSGRVYNLDRVDYIEFRDGAAGATLWFDSVINGSRTFADLGAYDASALWAYIHTTKGGD